MDMNTILQQLLAILQLAIPGLVVTIVTGLVKKLKEKLSGKVIVGIIVPLLSLLVAVVEYLLVDANFIWTFGLGFVSVFFYEVKKQFKGE
jgi:ABC-type antimicrobial peptide transport system permease subunit